MLDVKLCLIYLSLSRSLAFPQPRQTTWHACGAWRPGRSSESTAGTRRLWSAWPSMTACWAEEEDEEEEEEEEEEDGVERTENKKNNVADVQNEGEKNNE